MFTVLRLSKANLLTPVMLPRISGGKHSLRKVAPNGTLIVRLSSLWKPCLALKLLLPRFLCLILLFPFLRLIL
eukprot:11594891-Heterocapsa_arctica.AAC.1